ncbi:MAG: hypothetical protein ACKO02_03930 [Cyanobium sp.]
MSDPKSKIATRVEVFTRATADALNRAIGEVLDARSPWQLLHRLSRIVFLGLVLYLGWILVVVQPDLTRRLMVPHTPRFRERHALHREAVRQVLQRAAATPAFGLHSLLVAEWDGASAIHVLAVQGRSLQQPLEAGDELLVGVALAKVLGHVALGLCESERPAALGLEEAQLPAGAAVMVCPIGCVVSSAGQGLLVAIQAPAAGQAPGAQAEQRLRRQREQLMVLARRLATVMP